MQPQLTFLNKWLLHLSFQIIHVKIVVKQPHFQISVTEHDRMKGSGQDTGTGVRKLKLETHFCFIQFMTAPFNFLSLHFPFWKTGS